MPRPRFYFCSKFPHAGGRENKCAGNRIPGAAGAKTLFRGEQTMPLQVSIQSVDALGAEIYVSFNLTPSGSYTTAVGGDPLNFTSGGTLPAVADPAYIGLAATIISSQLLQCDVWSQGGNLVRQYVVNKTSSSPTSGSKLKLSAASTFGTEQTTAAYSSLADVVADILTGFAIFTKML
jgi:hypothetical protein